MPLVRFYEVQGDELNGDGGFIEVTEDGSVRVTPNNEWMLADRKDGGLLAPEDITMPNSPSTRPANGFRRVGQEPDGTVIYAPDPEEWDGRRWLDKVRYHFRTVYFRPSEIEE